MHSLDPLSPEMRQFLLRMRRLYYGRMEGVVIREGIPVDDPAPRIIRELKFGSERRNAADFDLSSYCLQPSVAELIREMGTLGHGEISCLEIQYGLPFRMETRM